MAEAGAGVGSRFGRVSSGLMRTVLAVALGLSGSGCDDSGGKGTASDDTGRPDRADARGVTDVTPDGIATGDAADGGAEGDAGTGPDSAGPDTTGPDAAGPDVAGSDVRSDGGGDGGLDDYCGEIDVLFVIDSSGSMDDNQQSLIASFPGFVQGMRNRLTGAPAFRVGVVTSSDHFGNRAGCGAIGSLITKTSGPRSSNRDCGPFDSGRAWLGHNDSALESRFACAAKVGVGGSDDERMMRAALNAVDPRNTSAGACNEGFAPTGSLLVLVLISDEDDVADGCDVDGTCLSYGSGGTPDDWVAELARHRGGSTDKVVALSLIGRRADNSCGAVVASRLLGFARRFGERGHVGDVCASSYDEFFEEALPIIDLACRKR